MTIFRYDPAILNTFPDINGGVMFATNLSNGSTPDKLKTAFETEQQVVLARLGEVPLSEVPSLADWRAAYRKFGTDPTKYRNAAEALLRRLTKKGDIPSINTLVDIGNMVSIRYALPVAVFDTRDIQGTVTVRFADGSERFTELGSTEALHPDPGEVIFVDESGMVLARRWCWRQSAQTTAREDTTEAIITVEAQGEENIGRALNDLLLLLDKYTGGNFNHDVLSSSVPSISF